MRSAWRLELSDVLRVERETRVELHDAMSVDCHCCWTELDLEKRNVPLPTPIPFPREMLLLCSGSGVAE